MNVNPFGVGKKSGLTDFNGEFVPLGSPGINITVDPISTSEALSLIGMNVDQLNAIGIEFPGEVPSPSNMPEPDTLLLVLSSLGAIGLARRRKFR